MSEDVQRALASRVTAPTLIILTRDGIFQNLMRFPLLRRFGHREPPSSALPPCSILRPSLLHPAFQNAIHLTLLEEQPCRVHELMQLHFPMQALIRLQCCLSRVP